MIEVSEIIKTKPLDFKTPLQEKTYSALELLNIDYSRVDTSEAITMEDCIEIDKKLNCKVVKTLLVCNRQQTEFYLFITTANKPFSTKNFGSALNISRVSFASGELLLSILGTKIGAATIFGLLLDSAKNVKLIIDKDILIEDEYGCTDGTTTGYMKFKMSDLLEKLIPYLNHTPTFIQI